MQWRRRLCHRSQLLQQRIHQEGAHAAAQAWDSGPREARELERNVHCSGPIGARAAAMGCCTAQGKHQLLCRVQSLTRLEQPLHNLCTCSAGQHTHNRRSQHAALGGERGRDEPAEGSAAGLDGRGQGGPVPSVSGRRLGQDTHGRAERLSKFTTQCLPSNLLWLTARSVHAGPAVACPHPHRLPTWVALRPTAGHSGGKRSPRRQAVANISAGDCRRGEVRPWCERQGRHTSTADKQGGLAL